MSQCPLCGGQKVDGFTTVTVDLGERLFVIRDVPAKICQQCGETWIEDSVAEKVEKIVAKLKKNSKEIEIVSFKNAA